MTFLSFTTAQEACITQRRKLTSLVVQKQLTAPKPAAMTVRIHSEEQTPSIMEKIENCNSYSLFLVYVTPLTSGSSCEGANTWSGSRRSARQSPGAAPGR